VSSIPLDKMSWPDTLGHEPRLEEDFQDFKAGLNEIEAETEANRCIHCYEAPCIQACPTAINIPQFIGRIGSGNTLGAAKTILESNILGHSCALSCPTEVLCEGACVYHHLNHKPIMIGRLQRFAVEHAYKTGAKFFVPGEPTGKRVALIGAGPASLACAHELRRLGHEATVYEKSALPGGLNSYGIAPYKMKTGVSLVEIEQIATLGVQFKFGEELGRTFQLSELVDSYNAVFLGLGLGPDSHPPIPGDDHPRVRGAVEFISQLKTLPSASLNWVRELRSALVVGGGNTALDACRELKGLGIPSVRVSYRRGQAEMSGYLHEFKSALQEGVEFHFNTVPVSFTSRTENSIQVEFSQTRITHDGSITVVPTGSFVEVELVLFATGQSNFSKSKNLFAEIPGLEFDRGKLKIDPNTGQTGNPKIFSGGDLTNGGKEVVNAVSDGKRAAHGIHEVLIHG